MPLLLDDASQAGRWSADNKRVSHFFPEPVLAPGEAIEWKVKSLCFTETGHVCGGMLCVTNQNLLWQPARAERKKASPIRIRRSDVGRIDPVSRRVGYSAGSQVWKPVQVTVRNGRDVTFAICQGRSKSRPVLPRRDWPSFHTAPTRSDV